jgi:NADPH:quinone reductase-like Zn-dependent oxidoreductase
METTRCACLFQHDEEVTVDSVSLSQLLPKEHLDAAGNIYLGPADILIKVRAVALSSLDYEVCEGKWHFETDSGDDLPIVTGYEFSGIVVSVGSAVARMNELLITGDSVDDNHQPTVRKGQAVVGLAPMNQRLGCMSEYTVQNVSCVVPKPALVLHEDAASIVGPGLRAMTALHHHITPRVDDTLLVVQGGSPTGRLAIQLAVHRGLRVLAMGDTAEEINFLEDLGARVSSQRGSLVRVLDSRSGHDAMLAQILEETGHVGVDCILEADSFYGDNSTEFKRIMLECLGTNGKYITTRRNLQLDPGESQRLALKGASLSFVFEQTWILSPSKQGQYLHIMNELLRFLADGTLGSLVGGNCTSLGRAREAYRALKTKDMGRVVVKIS